MTLKASESGLLHPEELTDAQRTMSEDQYNAEFECSFDAAILGAYWGKEMRQALEMGAFAMSEYDKLSRSRRHGTWAARTPPRSGSSSGSAGEKRFIDHYEANGEDRFTTPKCSREAVQIRRALAAPRCPRKDAGERRQVVIEQLLCLGIRGRSSLNLSRQDGIQAGRMILPACWFDRTRCMDGH
jgi:phage terminase large subunit